VLSICHITASICKTLDAVRPTENYGWRAALRRRALHAEILRSGLSIRCQMSIFCIAPNTRDARSDTREFILSGERRMVINVCPKIQSFEIILTTTNPKPSPSEGMPCASGRRNAPNSAHGHDKTFGLVIDPRVDSASMP